MDKIGYTWVFLGQIGYTIVVVFSRAGRFKVQGSGEAFAINRINKQPLRLGKTGH